MTDERHVMDEIDELIATELDDDGVPLDDYNQDRYVKCELCHHDWHGSPNKFGCPGAWATDGQKQEYDVDEYSKSLAGLGLRIVGVQPDHRLTAVFTNVDGHQVRGTVMFTPYEPGSVAVFMPDPPAGLAEYRYVAIDISEWRGMLAALPLYDEANNLNPPELQGFTDGGYIGDTP